MSRQFDEALSRLAEVYGMPNWMNNPKDGQDTDAVRKVWEVELSPYSPEQVKEACYRVIRWRKAQNFPAISELMGYLVDEEKKGLPENETRYQREVISCPEEEMIKTLRESGVKVPYGEGRDMLVRMIADFKMVYPRETLQLQTCSDIVKSMRLNGWWEREKFLEYVPAAFMPDVREKNLEAA